MDSNIINLVLWVRVKYNCILFSSVNLKSVASKIESLFIPWWRGEIGIILPGAKRIQARI